MISQFSHASEDLRIWSLFRGAIVSWTLLYRSKLSYLLAQLRKMGSGAWKIEKRDDLRSDSFNRDLENVLENGTLSIIVLGASGDLAKKKTFPALFHLFKQVLCSTSSIAMFVYDYVIMNICDYVK